MRKIVLLLTYALVVQPSLLFAQSNSLKAPPNLPQATQEQDNPDKKAPEPLTGDKKEWLLSVEQSLPNLLCDPKQYFIECFQVSQKECTEFTHLIVRACLNNVQLALPPTLDKQQGEYWGKMIGKCSYDLYEKFMQSKKLPKPGCDYTPSKKEASSETSPNPSEEVK